MAEESLYCSELMKRITDIFSAQVNRDLEAWEVTLSQMKMLVYLGKAASGSAPLKALEKAFGTSQATIAGIALRLEKKGLIQGRADPRDRRVKQVTLSPQGWALCRNAQVHMGEEEGKLLAGLSQAERAQLKELLEKIYRNLR